MKTELLKIAQDLEQGTITDNEARILLLGLLGIRKSFYCWDASVGEEVCDKQCLDCKEENNK